MIEILNVNMHSPAKMVSSTTSIEKAGKHARGASYGPRASLEAVPGEVKVGYAGNMGIKKISAYAQNYHKRHQTETQGLE